ncbi:hypothetical protein F0562_026831 [Nyssa sinensis]|uniref:Chromo domain-containing protein n=1 Tax=Nyssa sinensis TaxID=561372 RepID=A0A5J5BBQ6_9ASTE|nr:hypothetical protein F0562_026831 [Nyssa sinensis]
MQHVGCFIRGLKEAIRVEVEAVRPMTLTVVVGLAKLFEAKTTTTSKRNIAYLEPRRAYPFPIENNRTNVPVIQKFSPTKIEERRKKGLCFHCDEKIGPRHFCKKLFILEACYPNEEDAGNDELDPDVDSIEEVSTISLHAITGTPSPQKIRVRGLSGRYRVTILIYSASTHNFLNEEVATKLGLDSNIEGMLDVQVASGERLASKANAISQPIPQWVEPIKDKIVANSELQRLVQRCKDDEALGPWKYQDVHPVFHISLLKRHLGSEVEVQSTLPKAEDVTDHVLPQAILDQKQIKGKHFLLVHWKGFSSAKATWENLEEFMVKFPSFTLEDKGVYGREDMIQTKHALTDSLGVQASCVSLLDFLA